MNTPVPSTPWPVVRAAFKGHKRGEQMVETLSRLYPPPNGYSRGDGGCRVDWFDGKGHSDYRDTTMDSWGFKEPGQ